MDVDGKIYVWGVMKGCTGMKAAQMMKRHGTALMSRKWLRRTRLEREAKQKGTGVVGCDGWGGKRKSSVAEKDGGPFF
jgi:hypothetical protein